MVYGRFLLENKCVQKIEKNEDDRKTSGNCQALHIRLQKTAAENEDTLYSLRNFLAANPGLSTVYIHVPVPQGETVIRTANQIKPDPAASELQRWPEIANIWEEIE